MIMKHFTQIKNLLVLAVACFCGQMTVNAQEVDEEPEVLATFNMVDHITSGKSYVIGIQLVYRLTRIGWLQSHL